MITYKTGDLLAYFEDREVNFIAHCCNCQGVMGSGIALSIKQDYPEAYQAYKDYENDHGLLLGTVSGDLGIFNLHAQNLYKCHGATTERFVDYEALYICLEKLRTSIEVAMDNTAINIVPTVGFPKNMGADRAGGDWNVIEAMIKSVFNDKSGIDVLIVEFDGTRNK